MLTQSDVNAPSTVRSTYRVGQGHLSTPYHQCRDLEHFLSSPHKGASHPTLSHLSLNPSNNHTFNFLELAVTVLYGKESTATTSEALIYIPHPCAHLQTNPSCASSH